MRTRSANCETVRNPADSENWNDTSKLSERPIKECRTRPRRERPTRLRNPRPSLGTGEESLSRTRGAPPPRARRRLSPQTMSLTPAMATTGRAPSGSATPSRASRNNERGGDGRRSPRTGAGARGGRAVDAHAARSSGRVHRLAGFCGFRNHRRRGAHDVVDVAEVSERVLEGRRERRGGRDRVRRRGPPRAGMKRGRPRKRAPPNPRGSRRLPRVARGGTNARIRLHRRRS